MIPLAETTSPPISASLELLSGENAGVRFSLIEEKSILGRHPDCHILCDQGAVSRRTWADRAHGGRALCRRFEKPQRDIFE